MSTSTSSSGMAKAFAAAFFVAKTLFSIATGIAAATFSALNALAKRVMAARAAALEAAKKARAQAEQQPEPQPADGDTAALVPVLTAPHLSGPARAAARRREHHHRAALVAAALTKHHETALQHLPKGLAVKPHLHKVKAALKRLEVTPRPAQLLEKHHHHEHSRCGGVHKATTR